MKKKNVSYFILENVKGLVNHNNGKTLNEIVKALEDAGYDLEYRVLNSLNYGVPQMRERIYFIGIKKGLKKKKFIWPKPFKNLDIKDCLIDNDVEEQKLDDKIFQKYASVPRESCRFPCPEFQR